MMYIILIVATLCKVFITVPAHLLLELENIEPYDLCLCI
jgi:hypothetical protein